MSEVQMFDDVISMEDNGAAIFVMVDNRSGTRTPVRDDHFSVSDASGECIVTAVSKHGATFRHRFVHPNEKAAMDWVENVLRAHDKLAREIAIRHRQQL